MSGPYTRRQMQAPADTDVPDSRSAPPPAEVEAPATRTDDVTLAVVEAQEAERSRLAKEIHDGPAQALSNAIFHLDLIERLAAGDPVPRDDLLTELRQLRSRLRRELDEVRDVIHQLRPPALEGLGLSGAIAEAAEHLRSIADLAVSTDLAAPDDVLGDRERTMALRVAREALHNVRKHAGATTVLVTTALAGDDWTLEVRDDGRGFDPGAEGTGARRSFGLQIMRERAESIGARFEVRSRPGGGTAVRMTIPTGARKGAEENR